MSQNYGHRGPICSETNRPIRNTPGPHGINDAGDPGNRTVFGMPRGLMSAYRFATDLKQAAIILSSTRSAVLHLVGSVDQDDLDAAKRIINHVTNNPEASLKNLMVLAEAALTTALESIDICDVQDLMRKLGLPGDPMRVAADILSDSANPGMPHGSFFQRNYRNRSTTGPFRSFDLVLEMALG